MATRGSIKEIILFVADGVFCIMFFTDKHFPLAVRYVRWTLCRSYPYILFNPVIAMDEYSDHNRWLLCFFFQNMVAVKGFIDNVPDYNSVIRLV